MPVPHKSAPTPRAVAAVVLALAVAALLAAVPLRRDDGARRTRAARLAVATLRGAVDDYFRDHGTWPGRPLPGTPPPHDEATVARLGAHLFGESDARGRVEAGRPYGPYLGAVPVNPCNRRSDVRVLARAEAMPDAGDDSSGWIYDPETGEVRLNSPGCATADGGRWFDL